jgi:uncharacterized protein (TIGR04255 family)
MGRYLPFAGRNAIAEMSIGILFQSAFDSGFAEKFPLIKEEFTADFSKCDPVQQFVLNFGVTQPFPLPPSMPAPQNPSGVTFTNVKADGNPARLFRILSNTISFHIMEYTGWNEAKSLALDYIDRSLKKLATIDTNPATAIVVRYFDRFTFDGDPKTALAENLLRRDTDLVVARVFGTGPYWYCNSGWYQSLVNEELALNNLNIASAPMQATSSVAIDHTNLYTLSKPCNSLSELKQGTKDRPPLEDVLNKQHEVNVEVLKKLLIPEILKAIGLRA